MPGPGTAAAAGLNLTCTPPSSASLLCNLGLGTLSGLYGQVVLEIITP
ncbi:hypothetical protein [Saccharothrix xinjiangensis]|uniref:Uncharacterized protein n=1 Tax=Saccharothrix xinjiangensis TaxID=204798 RepID=A0ABV9Y733_9PSEU